MNDTSPSTLFDYYPRTESAAAPRASGSNLLPVSPRRPAHSVALAPHLYSVLDPRSEPFMQPFSVPSYLRHASLFADRFTTGSAAGPTQVGRPTLPVAAATATDYKGKSKQGGTFSSPNTSSTGPSPAAPVRDPILLPTCWNKDDACALLELTSDALGVSFAGSAKNGDRDAAAIRANRPVPNQAGVYYFEVKILDKGVSGYIGIGLCQRSVSLSRLPGWEDKSYGYHADDGRAFCCQGTGEPFGPVFTTGDIIGCGIDWTDAGPPKGPRERTGVKSSARDRERERSAAGSNAAEKDKERDKAAGGGGRVFFTKNGQFIDYAFCNLQGTLYPTIGLRTPNEAVRANFGAEPFAFDIESLVLERKRAVLARLATLPPPSYTASPAHFLPSPVADSTPPIPALLPPSDRERLHETIQALVSGYLHHHGFGETAERFEKQLKEERRERAIGLIPSAADQGGLTESTDTSNASSCGGEAAQQAAHRAEIRSALLSGTAAGAERALQLVESHFPAVLESGSMASTTVGVNKAGGNDGLDVAFRLKSRVFIEAALEWSLANRDPAGMEHSAMSGETPSHADTTAAEGDGDSDTAMMSSSIIVTDVPPSAPLPSSSPLTLDSLLALGQSLHAEYGSDPRPRVREELQAVLGLMAYRDPEKEATGRTGELLGKAEREDLVDQVNRAVMRASGLPPVPALEALFRHATASIQLAAELGSGSAAMIDLRSQILGR